MPPVKICSAPCWASRIPGEALLVQCVMSGAADRTMTRNSALAMFERLIDGLPKHFHRELHQTRRSGRRDEPEQAAAGRIAIRLAELGVVECIEHFGAHHQAN